MACTIVKDCIHQKTQQQSQVHAHIEPIHFNSTSIFTPYVYIVGFYFIYNTIISKWWFAKFVFKKIGRIKALYLSAQRDFPNQIVVWQVQMISKCHIWHT